MRILRSVLDWLVDRLGWEGISRRVLRHPVPRETAEGRKGWMYVFGTAILAVLLLQILTGILLVANYVPAPAEAYESLEFITDRMPFGSFLRAVHFFGASAMVVLVLVHVLRVFLTGSYKFPREFNWLTGVALLVLTVAMAFTGQLLRWDANGVWGVFVASHYAGRVPGIGEALKEFVLAGETVGGATLTRFFGLHVIIMPLLILALVGLHVFLAFHNGVSEPPDPDRPVDPSSYRQWYREMLEREGKPYFPFVAVREMAFVAIVMLVIATLALTVGPRGPAAPPDPTFIPAEPKPDWFLLWYYGLLSVKPPQIETFVMVYMPMFIVIGMILLPFVFRRGHRSPRKRPLAVITVAVVVVAFGVFTELGARSPWVMDFETRPISALVAEAPTEIQRGADLFHERGCQYCHSIEGAGGAYGPPLDDVMRRLPPGIVTARIVQGFNNMPGYRATLTVEELNTILALLTFLSEP